jgi:hypothetical protein
LPAFDRRRHGRRRDRQGGLPAGIRAMMQYPSNWAQMLKIFLYGRRQAPIAPVQLLAVAGLLLLVAACAAGSSTDASDNAKNHGFYGSVLGGWTQAQPQP